MLGVLLTPISPFISRSTLDEEVALTKIQLAEALLSGRQCVARCQPLGCMENNTSLGVHPTWSHQKCQAEGKGPAMLLIGSLACW